MSIYERYGVRPLINAAGTKTRLGGGSMAPDVLQAMTEASQRSVDMAALQAAASRVIAGVTGAEAGYVTSGAAAALTLSAAACITGLDPVKIDRLPHADGMPNEIVLFRLHRNSYDHAWRASGARLVDVGVDDRVARSGVRSIEPWEIEAAIGERTVAVAYVAGAAASPPLEDFVRVAHAHDLPVLVDAAGQLPPKENLRKFIATGADLVAFSGGKAIGGPQATGVLCGRKDLIQAVLLNHLDMDMDLSVWNPPEDLLPRNLLGALPRHGIGRGFKVGKEEIIGLLVALEQFASGAWQDTLDARREYALDIVRELEGVEGVDASLVETVWYPRVAIRFARTDVAERTYRSLLDGDPGIALDPADVHAGILTINTGTIAIDDEPVVASRVLDACRRTTKTPVIEEES